VVSFIGKAKRSVDSTVDAYMGRAAFAVCIIFAVAFAMAGIGIVIENRFGTMVACFAMAGIFILASIAIRFTVAASERSAERDIEDVEKTIEDSGLAAVNALPFDLSTAMTVLPLVLPLLKYTRRFLPYLLVAGLVIGYFVSTTGFGNDRDEEEAPEPRPEPEPASLQEEAA
jgi:hypothetical protein